MNIVFFSVCDSLPSTIDPTIATNTLQRQRLSLLDNIRYCLGTVANALFAEFIIPQDLCEEACNESKGSTERGRALLDCVASRIELSPSDFTKVVRSILFLQPVAKALVKSYGE
jgi:hypothetical protein